MGVMGWKKVNNYEDYRKWALEKIERDYNCKIFFPEFKKATIGRYEALKEVFSNTEDVS